MSIARPINHRMAAVVAYRYQNPFATWSDVATATGVPRRTIYHWRARSSEWADLNRQAATQHVAELAPAALHALIAAWKEGRAEREAIEYLRATGLISPAQASVGITVQSPPLNLDSVEERLLGRLRQLAAGPDNTIPDE